MAGHNGATSGFRLAALGATFLLTAGTGELLGAQAETVQELAGELRRQAEVLRLKYKVPGVAVALVHEGEPVVVAGFGLADEAAGRPVEADTVFQVASVSKPVAAWGVLGLMAQGRLAGDAPIEDYLTRWQLPRSGFDSKEVTLRRLLSHTAGLGVHGYFGFAPGTHLPTLEDLLDGKSGTGRQARRVGIESEPGSRFRYSGGGYTVLQLIVEEVTGEPFAHYMRKAVLDPLGMSRTSFQWTPEVAASSATPYGWNRGVLPHYRFTAQAAGGLYSTATDLARFLAALGEEIDAKDGGEGRLRPFAPQEGAKGVYGLGFALEPIADGRTLVFHQGANRGWRAMLAAFPAEGEGLVVLSNSDRALPLVTDLVCTWSRWVTGDELASCWVERKRRGTVLAVAGIVGLGLVLNGSWFLYSLLAGRRNLRWRNWRQRRQGQPGARVPTAADRRRGGFPPPARVASRLMPVLSRLWLPWSGVVLFLRVGFPVGVAVLWWVFWYTDEVVVRREGVENFTPVSSMPPTFRWLTLMVLLWCLLGVLRAFLPTQTRTRTLRPRRPTQVFSADEPEDALELSEEEAVG